MDKDLINIFDRLSRQRPSDLKPWSNPGLAQEWPCTGLCPQAQADGVPCYELGRSCDVCGMARKPQKKLRQVR
jgi:hypothetical protein